MLFQNKGLPLRIWLERVDQEGTYDALNISAKAPVLKLNTGKGHILFSQYKLGKYQGHYYMRVVSEDSHRPFNDFTPDQLNELNEILKVLNA